MPIWKFHLCSNQKVKYRLEAHGIFQETVIHSGTCMWFKSRQWNIRSQFPEASPQLVMERNVFSLLPKCLRWLKASLVTSCIFVIIRDPTLAWSLHCEWQMESWKEPKSLCHPWASGSTNPEACHTSATRCYTFSVLSC